MNISVLFEILTLIIVGYSAHQNPDSYVFVIISGIVAFIAIKYITFRTTVKEIERIMSLPDEEQGIPLPEEKPDNPQAIKIAELLNRKGIPTSIADTLACNLSRLYQKANWVDASSKELEDGMYLVFSVKKTETDMEFSEYYSFRKNGEWDDYHFDHNDKLITGFSPLIANVSSFVSEEKAKKTIDFVRSIDFDSDDSDLDE